MGGKIKPPYFVIGSGLQQGKASAAILLVNKRMNKRKMASLKMLATSIGVTQRVVRRSTYSFQESFTEVTDDNGVVIARPSRERVEK